MVLKKKSCGDTSKKNFTVSYAKLAMIAKVIKIVNQLHILKKFFKKSSLKPVVAFLGPIHINIQTSLIWEWTNLISSPTPNLLKLI